MIIEFNGLPGSGKTTVANSLKKELEELGYQVYLSFPTPASRIKRYIMTALDGSLWLLHLGRQFARKAVTPKDQNREKYAFILIKYYRMYKEFLKNQQNDAVLIVDQGILQGIASIVHMDEISEQKHLNRIFRWLCKRVPFVMVDCKNEATLAYERMRVRHFENRWDQYDDETTMKGLNNQTRTFDVIRDCAHTSFSFGYIAIDTNATPAVNAEHIISAFLKR